MGSSCKEIEQMLVDYADGRLSPGESSKVAAHLSKCEDCRRTLEALKRSLELAGIIWEDGLAETEAIRVPIPEKVRKVRWPGYAAVAASILLIFTVSVIRHVLVGPPESESTFADIERRISDSASAIRLLAAADLLAKYPDTEAIAKRQYHYVVKKYPETPAAAEAKLRIE
ncbi:MAG: anti-sigma factor family protein [Planctomycetota bacterium]|jgi:predicted anti-sigma-YlaC factor YlaD